MTRRTIKFTCTDVRGEGYDHNGLQVTAENVDVTDFLDLDMAFEELGQRELLNEMDPEDVADWLRGQGYHVEEE